MLPAPCFVFSDVHLGACEADAEAALLSFLRALPAVAGSVLVNGDLFDFWFEWRSVMPRRGYRVLAALADLRDGGVPVVWVAGNHDGWGGEVLREDVGVDYRVGPWHGTLGGWLASVEHGDGLRAAEDRPYRALRRVIRHPLAVRSFRALHPDLGSRIALGSSHTSRTRRARDGGRALRDVAMERLDAAGGPELVIFGHSHVAALERSPGRGGIYANPGAWLSEPTYLRVDPYGVSLNRWDRSRGQGERLDVLGRSAEEMRRDP